MTGPEIRIVGERVRVHMGRKKLAEAALGDLLDFLGQAGEPPNGFPIRPSSARIWVERRDAVAAAFELPPHARTVRWLKDGSKVPFGRKASYEQVYLSFPWVVLLLVFRGGALTNQQQLYYRTESMDTGEDLLLPNLYNVAQGYGQRCWVCLQHVKDVSSLPWPDKVARIVDHTFSAAWNRSSEEHEGNSYWSRAGKVDERVATIAAWQEASRANRRFALDVKWEPAGTTASSELRTMLDRVVKPSRPTNAEQLASLVAGCRKLQERAR